MTVDSRRPERVVTPAGPAAPRRSSGRLPGLDGLRALAIIAVLVFHLDATWLPGGFLGVDVFFVISGFLITTLLQREHARTGTIALREFWRRRARRLLPALLLLVPGCVLLARMVQGDLLVGIGRQSLGALTFSSNWLEIGAGSDYFNATSPQLFMNLWSLAVEEQFYLVWPLAALALLRLGTARSRAAVALGLALGSAALMAALYDPAGVTRVYYGTDTHAMGLMLGAALAFAYAAPHRAWTTTATWERRHAPLAFAALATLVAAFWLLDETHAATFRGGILLASLATAVLLLAVVSTPGPLQRAMEWAPLRWVGERSYGLYLWHWPVILIVGQDVPAAGAATTPGYLWTRVWCVVVTVAVADLSFRYIEAPVRRHGFRGAAKRGLSVLRSAGTRHARMAWASVLLAAVCLSAVYATAPQRTSTEELIAANAAREQAAAAATSSPDARAATRPGTGPSAQATPTERGPAQTRPGEPDWSMPDGDEIDIVGDSMVVASIPALRYYFPQVRIDARSSRKWPEGVTQLTARGSGLRRAVVLGLGTNAGTDIPAIERALKLIGPDRMVVLTTIHGAWSRTPSDNAKLRAIAAKHPNVAIADWNAALEGTTGQLQPDKTHPSQDGQHLYAKTIRAALAQISERKTGTKVTLKDLPIP